MIDLEQHPLERYRSRRGWTQDKSATHFGMPISTYKQVVRAFTGVSPKRADKIESASGGELQAIDILRWHQRNRRDLRASA